jgi:Small metal-binding protein
MKSFVSRLSAIAFCVGLVFSPLIASAENAHVTAAIKETREAVVEGRQQLYSSFIEHTANALDHAREAIASGHNPRGHVKVAADHLRGAMKIAKGTHHAHRLGKGVREAEKALIHLKAANAH